jgi:hypothetical protein
VRHSNGNLKKAVYSHKYPNQKIREISDKYSYDASKTLRITRASQPQTGQKSINWKPKNDTGINETKSWLFEKINKIDKTVAKLTEKRKEKTQINKIRDEKGILQQTLMKLRRSYGNTLKTYTPENWKMKKK